MGQFDFGVGVWIGNKGDASAAQRWIGKQLEQGGTQTFQMRGALRRVAIDVTPNMGNSGVKKAKMTLYPHVPRRAFETQATRMQRPAGVIVFEEEALQSMLVKVAELASQ